MTPLKNQLDREISRIWELLRRVVHRESDFLFNSHYRIETLDKLRIIYPADSRPHCVIERLYLCGPCIDTATIFIDKNRFCVDDRFVDAQNSLVVRCNEPNGLLFLGQDVNLYRCEFDLGIVGAPSPPPSFQPPTIVVANGVSATSSRFQSASNGDIVLGMCSALAKNSILRTHDDHSIVDISLGEIVNSPISITLEGYNWICEDVVVLKGVTIGYGSVLAARAVATKDCPRKSLFAGVPANVVRQNISWQSHPYSIDLEHLNNCMHSCESELKASNPSASNFPAIE